jgi:hypothetical protein
MPTLEFKGKQFIHSYHLSMPFRVDGRCLEVGIGGGGHALSDLRPHGFASVV